MGKCDSFAPIIGKKSKILILGSMPGGKSLEKQQYYAHPQNRFWKLAGLLCSVDNLYELPYEQKLQTLLDNGFALWDVIKSCDRTGSMDSNIKNEIPNEISKLLKKYPRIQKICLNGNKAYSSFKKHFPELIQNYKCYKMPSTSPANARYKLTDLYKIWNEVLNNN